ncbi:MAG: right-handed parallel beta-helix repeat-containing protein [Candidatus Bathyarchaeota archaeon]
MNKTGIRLIFLLLLCLSIVQSPKQVTGNTQKTIIVPNDFASIQEAINNASNGDTVFVKNGVYKDLSLINKSITLIGENKEKTIIDSIGIESRVYIEADHVTITGFTIKNADSHGIRLGLIEFEPDSEYQPIGCKIIGNNIENNERGIYVRGGTEHIISENIITGSKSYGIELHSSKTIISRNNIYNNREIGITIDQAQKVIIKGNTIKDNGHGESGTGGINLRSDGQFYIFGNNITNNQIGIQFDANCNNSTVSKNNIE